MDIFTFLWATLAVFLLMVFISMFVPTGVRYWDCVDAFWDSWFDSWFD